MKLIVGLGNPGIAYLRSRHNIGFSVVKALAKDYKIPLKKERGISALCAKACIDNQAVIMATPLTYMNLSGVAVLGLLKRYRIDLASLLVVCDDLDLEFGRLKLRPAGSSAGQRGLESIIEALGCREFSRLRVGIGRPPANAEASDYVLAPFSRKEREQTGEIIEKAAECCQSWVVKGVNKTMEIFNKSALSAGHPNPKE